MSVGPNHRQVVRRGFREEKEAHAVCVVGVFEPPEQSDTITVEYPSGTVEIYRYREGGLTGTILASVTVTYLTASKKDITSVEVA